MTVALEIHSGDDNAPVDPDDNAAFHRRIIDGLIATARGYGWAGADFCFYQRRRSGVVGIGIRPGAGWPDLDRLRAFRETWVRPVDPEPDPQPEQGSMF